MFDQSVRKEAYILFRKGEWFILGWIYFILMFFLEAFLPAWTGDENGIIENIQLLVLFGSMYYCYKLCSCKLPDWGGEQKSLWKAGIIYFFLLIMREISWGRTFVLHPDGSMYQYSEMGLYGKLVHPLVGILIIATVYFLYRAKIFSFIKKVKIPVKTFCLLLLFIAVQYVAEHMDTPFKGNVAEELCELGAYIMMYYLIKDSVQRLKKQ